MSRIEGESVEGLLLEAVVRRLRGAPGSRVRITSECKGEEYDVIARRSPLPYMAGGEPAGERRPPNPSAARS